MKQNSAIQSDIDFNSSNVRLFEISKLNSATSRNINSYSSNSHSLEAKKGNSTISRNITLNQSINRKKPYESPQNNIPNDQVDYKEMLRRTRAVDQKFYEIEAVLVNDIIVRTRQSRQSLNDRKSFSSQIKNKENISRIET